ncbi:UDP-N-acetylmuramoyl-L-alanine--D-glutamate ligase [Ahniella affigens]|uniref:UDP-N-acetylmuramoylalanine--D-glutamate ligase n=1 Tax=Ahniella affigens TaxID=2021234 RepID=A0A2P1PQF9_9GAMM|nr:UDP-N-acetylmuramoyl-L-alanine--D-glutamate ligase [Ahniella affigens]AVP97081.1 UDP-N-acetylmuramoyl-L-alanine--D-glutamate ligase [Ahniella affigens]
MQLEALRGCKVAIWGFGREGRAALLAVRRACPGQGLVVLCSAAEREDVAGLNLDHVDIDCSVVDATVLRRFDVVIKSPGISPYQVAVEAAADTGVRFVSGSQLWFAAHRSARTICVTATKGKSTTTSLIAHLLRSLGVRTGLAGNIGLPLLEVLDPDEPPAIWVIELSSFQTRDADAKPTLAVINNLLEEHLDWHGSVTRYRQDKLALIQGAEQVLLNASDPVLAAMPTDGSRGSTHWYNQAQGWHVAGCFICHGRDAVFPIDQLPIPGRHNAENACAALAAIALLGYDAILAAPALATFQPLPHRLQTLGVRSGIRYINDSIATTPAAALAAYEFAARNGLPVAQIVGGHDRGLDWQDFIARMCRQPPTALIWTGAAGARVFASLTDAERAAMRAQFAAGFDAAFALAQLALSATQDRSERGTVLLSPGAPSFGQFKDYVARGKHFAELAGFASDDIAGIAGLGIA